MKWLYLVLVLLVACSQSERAVMPSSDVEVKDYPLPSKPSLEPPVGSPSDSLVPLIIEIEARQFEFVPSVVRVKKGEFVRLVITSRDVEHGFSLPAFGVNERLPKDKEVVVEFVADQAGRFPFFCSVMCGSGHSGMNGELIVEG